jgi:hypothetical protein
MSDDVWHLGTQPAERVEPDDRRDLEIWQDRVADSPHDTVIGNRRVSLNRGTTSSCATNQKTGDSR